MFSPAAQKSGNLPLIAAVVAEPRDLVGLSADTLSALDLFEIRADMFEDGRESVVREALRMGRGLGKRCLLTIRRRDEGGARPVSDAEREHLYLSLMEDADLLDVEVSSTGLWGTVAAAAKRRQVPVIGSCHRFDGTPDEGWMEDRFREARGLGADVFKLAAMAGDSSGLARLLAFTHRHREDNVIVLGMGPWGLLARVAAPVLGSLVTYGYLSRPSAPGQLSVPELSRLLRLFHPGYIT